MNFRFRFINLIAMLLVMSLCLSGCQIVELLWPNTDLQEIADVLPDEADMQKLEEAIDEMEK